MLAAAAEDAEATSRLAADSVPDQMYTGPTRQGRSRLHEETAVVGDSVADREGRSLGLARDRPMLESVAAAVMAMESTRVDAAVAWTALAIGLGHSVGTGKCR